MNAPIPEVRTAVRELAGLLAKPDGQRLLSMLGYASGANWPDSEDVFRRIAEDAPPDPRKTRGVRVGIWESQEADGAPAFVRRADLEPVELWSEAERIPARRPGRKRVALLGESVARGFYHDPHFNPAAALARMLGTALGEHVEVIDLARTDVGMLQLLRLSKAALLLEPDALVIWAGNNWHPAWAFREGRLPEVGVRLREQRAWAPMKGLLDDTLQYHLTRFTATLGSLRAASGVPVVFAVPEFNLGDWRDVCTAPALRSADDTLRWLDTRNEAQLAVDGGDAEAAQRLGRRLLDIDGGSTPASYYILADASRLAGDRAEERRLLRLSREVSLFWPRSLSPGVYAAVRRHLIEAAPACGFEVVDIERLLESYTGGALPDRRLFHDYCHMTEEGTRVCVAHMAEQLMPLLGGPAYPAERFASVDLGVAAEVAAAANFLAAVVNANLGQSRGIVRYHLAQAARGGAAIAPLISLFLDFRIRRTPALLCDSLERLLGALRLTSWGLAYGTAMREDEKPLNFMLVEECSRAAAALDPAAPAGIERLLYAEHGVSSREIDLLQASSALTPHERQMYRGQMGYYCAFDPISTFTLVCDAPGAVRLCMTARSGESPGLRKLRISVNAAPVAAVPVSRRWSSETVLLPEETLRRGVNQISIEWPPPDWDHERRIDASADLFEQNVAPEISPVYGHLSALRAAAQPREAAGGAGSEADLMALATASGPATPIRSHS